MALTFIHTSDWHLGLHTGQVSRQPDQQNFHNWLIKQIDTHQVDILVVAGDIFDTMSPSTEAQTDYYRLLSKLTLSGLKHVIIVGGNHDSPSQLNAPSSLLDAFNIHVIGGVLPEDQYEQMVIPLYNRADQLSAVCLAVPYIHEYRMGIRRTMGDPNDVRDQFQAKFGELYRKLTDIAAEKYPGVPIMATGHLTLGMENKKEDAPQEIHMVGYITGLPKTIFDPRIDYVALGHIHRAYRVYGCKARYSGSPIPFTTLESESPRKVILGQLTDEKKVITELEVPVTRHILSIEGSLNEIQQQLAEMTWETPMAPLIHVTVLTDQLIPNLRQLLTDETQQNRPILVELRLKNNRISTITEKEEFPNLPSMTPIQTFELLLEHRGHDPNEEQPLINAFNQLVDFDYQALNAFIQSIENGEAQ